MSLEVLEVANEVCRGLVAFVFWVLNQSGVEAYFENNEVCGILLNIICQMTGWARHSTQILQHELIIFHPGCAPEVQREV